MSNYENLSPEAMIAELERLRESNAALTAAQTSRISVKLSQKGAVSVYGLGRFPVTLYAEQWPRLLECKERILAFIEENKASLSFKNK